MPEPQDPYRELMNEKIDNVEIKLPVEPVKLPASSNPTRMSTKSSASLDLDPVSIDAMNRGTPGAPVAIDDTARHGNEHDMPLKSKSSSSSPNKQQDSPKNVPGSVPASTSASGSGSPPAIKLAATSSDTRNCKENGYRRFMISVVSSPKHFLAREAIRQTWAADARSVGITVKFFIGQLPEDQMNLNKKINEEGDDVVRLTDFTENYHNLTAKALGIFGYAHEKCMTGVFKVDDDSYVRVNKLLEFLATQNDWNSLYAGVMVRDAPVFKDPNGRWYAYDQYPYETWPTYANGPGFFLGQKALGYISEHRGELNKIRIDDAAVGVWTQPLQLSITSMTASIFEYHPNKDAIFQNPVDAEEMIRLKNNEDFIPRACMDDQQYACLCWGNPNVSPQEFGECWDRAGRASYSDNVRRS